MAQEFPTTADLNNKNGGDENLIDVINGTPWWLLYEHPHYVAVTRMIWLLATQSMYTLQVYKSDSDTLRINMRAGYILRGATIDTVAAVEDDEDGDLTNNDTNYVYLLYAGSGTWTLTIVTDATGWPTASIPAWIPLAIVKCGTDAPSGTEDDFDPDPAKLDIIDMRHSWLFAGGASAALGGGTIDSTLGTVGSPRALTDANSGMVHANLSAGAMDYQTLPSAAAGMSYTFIVENANGLRITANTGDTIQVSDQVSIAAGYAESTQVGAAITLVALNATEWIATSIMGEWTVETS